MQHKNSLKDSVKQHLKDYFLKLNGEKNKSNLHSDVMNEVEKILISEALKYCNDVQSHAANFLGLNRNTLRAKIKQFNINNSDE